MPTSLRLTGRMPAECLVCERGLERHAKPLGGGQACPPGGPCPPWAAREVEETTTPQPSARLPDGEHAREAAQGQAGPLRRLPGVVRILPVLPQRQVDLGDPGVAFQQVERRRPLESNDEACCRGGSPLRGIGLPLAEPHGGEE